MWGREGEPFWRRVLPPFPTPHPSLSQDFQLVGRLCGGRGRAVRVEGKRGRKGWDFVKSLFLWVQRRMDMRMR